MLRKMWKVCILAICVLVIVPGLVAFVKRKVVKSMNKSMDCVGWEGSGSCEKCSTSVGPWWEIHKMHVKNLKASCSQCPTRWVLLSGPPSLNPTVKTPKGEEFEWENHCAELEPVGPTQLKDALQNERQVLMIRHGESTWNDLMEKSMKTAGAFGLFLGEDAPLSAFGLRQAQRLANILKQADAMVYNVSGDAGDRQLIAARSDLAKDNLEEEVVITDKIAVETVTDKAMVQNLVTEENRLLLDVLLGRRCEETNFISSPLVRAIDTLLITTMERSQRCKTPWQISSNLQEIEHNADCEPTLQPGQKPSLRSKQRDEYVKAKLGSTSEYVAEMYQNVDTSRHGVTKTSYERLRLFDQSSQMLDELIATFASPKRFHVWAGHSIWFRVFFQYFADLSNRECKALAGMKVANTAIVSVKLRPVKNSPRKYVAYDCKFVHLGSDKEFKMHPKKKGKIDAGKKDKEPAKTKQEM